MENTGYRDPRLPTSAPPSYNQCEAKDDGVKSRWGKEDHDGFQPHPIYVADNNAASAPPYPPYPTAYPNASYPNAYQNTYPTSNPPVYPPNAYAAAPYPPAAYPGPKYPTAYDGGAPGGRRGNGDVLISDVSVAIVPSSDHVDDGVGDNQALANEWSTSSFSDKAIRRTFIRKVFFILMTQLSVTVGFICLFVFCEPVKNFVHANGYWFYPCSYITFLVTYIVLVCCPSVRRSFPSNFICLAIFTLALSYMTGTISSYHDTEIVLIAVAITAGVCLSLTIFALQTRIDFTMCSGLLFALCMVVFFFGFACIIGGAFMSYQSSYIMHCVYGALAALLFSLFLVYDIQMVMGGHKYALSPEEYIYGALQIYLDVVYLFIIILGLFGGKK